MGAIPATTLTTQQIILSNVLSTVGLGLLFFFLKGLLFQHASKTAQKLWKFIIIIRPWLSWGCYATTVRAIRFLHSSRSKAICWSVYPGVALSIPLCCPTNSSSGDLFCVLLTLYLVEEWFWTRSRALHLQCDQTFLSSAFFFYNWKDWFLFSCQTY